MRASRRAADSSLNDRAREGHSEIRVREDDGGQERE